MRVPLTNYKNIRLVYTDMTPRATLYDNLKIFKIEIPLDIAIFFIKIPKTLL